jgi:hypothetical protein
MNETIGTEITGQRFNDLAKNIVLIKFFPPNDILRDYLYKTGLNVDTKPFNPRGNCSGGGLYFTELKHFNDFKSYGSMVALIHIPNNARVYTEHKKWKADQILVNERMKYQDFIEQLSDTQLLDLLKYNKEMIEYIPKNKINYELCLNEVQHNGLMLKFVPENLKDDELCLISIKQNQDAIKFLPNIWMPKTSEWIVKIAKIDSYLFDLIPDKLKNKDMYKIAIEKNGLLLKKFPKDMKSRDICIRAVEKNGLAFKHVPIELRDREMCIRAVEKNGLSLQHVPIELRDREMCMRAIKKNGLSLKHVPIELRDREMCMKAIERNNLASKHVPTEYVMTKKVELVQNITLNENIIPNKINIEQLVENVKQLVNV